MTDQFYAAAGRLFRDNVRNPDTPVLDGVKRLFMTSTERQSLLALPSDNPVRQALLSFDATNQPRGPSITGRAIVVGDSLAAHHSYESHVGNTIEIRFVSRFFHILNGLLNGRLNFVNNAGVSGQRTDEILARWDNKVLGPGFHNGESGTGGSESAALYPGVTNVDPDLIFVIAGLNDILQNLGVDVAFDGVIALWRKALSYGAWVFGATLPVFNGVQAVQVVELNKRLTAAAKDMGVIMGIPFYEVMIDPTSALFQNKTGYTQDEGTARLHPNNRAAWEAAIIAADIVRPYTTSYNILPQCNWDNMVNNPDSKYLMTNSMFQGAVAATGVTGISGTYQTGALATAPSNGATTRVYSQVAGKKGNVQRMLVTATGVENNADLSCEDVKARFVFGREYRAVARLKLTKSDGVTPLDGSENVQFCELRARIGLSDGRNYWFRGMAAGSPDVPNGLEVNTQEVVAYTPWIKPVQLAAETCTIARAAINVGFLGAGACMAHFSECQIEYR